MRGVLNLVPVALLVAAMLCVGCTATPPPIAKQGCFFNDNCWQDGDERARRRIQLNRR